MRLQPLTLALALTAVLAALTAAGSIVPDSADRPAGTKPLSASLADDTIQLYKDNSFGGTMTQVSDVTSKPSWQDQDFTGKKENNFSSLRWRLPRGVVVNLWQYDRGQGNTLALFGSGEIDSLKPWKLSDEASCWSWNYVGGAKAPAQRVLDGRAPRPRYARELEATMPDDSIQLFKDRNLKGKMTALEHVSGAPTAGAAAASTAGVFRDTPESGKSTTSLRWKLPEGVLVVFAEGKNGEGRQLAIWGSGQFDEVNNWNMNDRFTQWAWYDLRESRD